MIEVSPLLYQQAQELMPDSIPEITTLVQSARTDEQLAYSLYCLFQKGQGNIPLDYQSFGYGSCDPRDRLEIRRPTRERFRVILTEGFRPKIVVARKLIKTAVRLEGVSANCMLLLHEPGFRGTVRYSPEECIKMIIEKSPENLFYESEQDTFKAAL